MEFACNDIIINIIFFISDDSDYSSLGLINKKWYGISTSKSCLKSFLEHQYGLDERPIFKDHYKSLFYSSKRYNLEIMVFCGFHKKLKDHLQFTNNGQLAKLMGLALINERPKTFLMITKLIPDSAIESLMHEISSPFKIILQINSFMIDLIFQYQVFPLISEKVFYPWFEYASFNQFKKYIDQFESSLVFTFVTRLITIYNRNNYRDVDKKVELLLVKLGSNMSDKELDTLLFQLFHHRTPFTNVIFDFVLGYPFRRLKTSDYLVPLLIDKQKYDYFEKHKQNLKLPLDNFVISLIHLNNFEQFHYLTHLKKWRITEEIAFNFLKHVKYYENPYSVKWHTIFRDAIDTTKKPNVNPFEYFAKSHLHLLTIWCTERYVVDFIENYYIYVLYDDYDFMCLVQSFLSPIKNIQSPRRESLVTSMIKSMGLNMPELLQLKRSIIKTFKTIKTWYCVSDDPRLLKIIKMLTKFLPHLGI